MNTERKRNGRPYWVPEAIAAWAEKEASKQCRATGKPVRWTDVIRQVLEEKAK